MATSLCSQVACHATSLGSLSISVNGGRRTAQATTRKMYTTGVRAEIVSDTEVGEDAPAASSSSGPPPAPSTSAPAYKIPQPRRFYVRPDKFLDMAGGALSLPFRLGTGVFVSGYQAKFVPKAEVPADTYSMVELGGYKLIESSNLLPRPEKPIEIYEFEGCPFCRKVREIVSILDLDVLYYPCPKDGPTFRPKAIKLGGKKQFPYMVDPNSGVSMYESDDIIKYLVTRYGDGNVPRMLSLGLFTTLTAGFAMIGRAGKGSKYTPAKTAAAPLELWAYEGSPFCKIVREALVELELPHIQHSTPRGSSRRTELFQKTGTFQVPYLEDPNTGVKMFESAEIIEYLRAEYALPAAS